MPLRFELLSPRQLNVATLASQGLTNKQTLTRTGQSNYSLIYMLADIYDLLGIKSRRELIKNKEKLVVEAPEVEELVILPHGCSIVHSASGKS